MVSNGDDAPTAERQLEDRRLWRRGPARRRTLSSRRARFPVLDRYHDERCHCWRCAESGLGRGASVGRGQPEIAGEKVQGAEFMNEKLRPLEAVKAQGSSSLDLR